jgi:hypothetical protein
LWATNRVGLGTYNLLLLHPARPFISGPVAVVSANSSSRSPARHFVCFRVCMNINTNNTTRHRSSTSSPLPLELGLSAKEPTLPGALLLLYGHLLPPLPISVLRRDRIGFFLSLWGHFSCGSLADSGSCARSVKVSLLLFTIANKDTVGFREFCGIDTRRVIWLI